MLAEARIGPLVGSDGPGPQPVRLSRDGSLVVNDGHARYYEPTVRGVVFSATGPQASATSSSSTAGAAAGTFPAASSPLGALYNPAASGKNLVVLKAAYSQVSAGTGPGLLSWYIGPTAPITAGTKLPLAANNGTGAVPVGIAYGATSATAIAALTGQSQLNILRPFSQQSGTQTTFGTTTGYANEPDVAGEIVVVPGSVLALASTVAAATLVAGFSITWEEVAV